MYRDGWKSFVGTAGEQWKYYDSGELDSSKVGQLMVHGVIVTDLDGRKDAENSYLIDKDGYLLKKTMKKATDGKYYLTDKNLSLIHILGYMIQSSCMSIAFQL